MSWTKVLMCVAQMNPMMKLGWGGVGGRLTDHMLHVLNKVALDLLSNMFAWERCVLHKSSVFASSGDMHEEGEHNVGEKAGCLMNRRGGARERGLGSTGGKYCKGIYTAVVSESLVSLSLRPH